MILVMIWCDLKQRANKTYIKYPIWIWMKVFAFVRLHLPFVFEKRILTFSMGLVHYLQDLQISFLIKTFIKNKSHGTIHTFKNYFAIVFSIFSFQ